MKKRIILLGLLVVSFLNVYADNQLTVAPVTIPEGGTGIIEIILKNDKTYDGGYAFRMVLPEGISYVSSERGERFVSPDNPSANAVGSTVTFAWLATSRSVDHITGTDGVLLKVTVSANESLSQGDVLDATIKEINFATSTTEDTFADVNFTITIGAPADTRTVLDELATTLPAAATGVDVRVLRTIKADEWSTIVLPFDMTAGQVKEAFGSDVQLGDFAGTETTFDDDDNVVGVTASFEEVSVIEANHPYIIKVSAPITEFTVDDVDINADEDEACVEFDNGKSGSRRVVYSGFYGTYHAGTVLDEFTLFLSDNKFWYSAGSTKMKAFRAYFDFLDILTEVEEGAGARIAISFSDDGTTGINAIGHSPLSIDHFFDLQGRPVVKPGKGIYVKEGKKVVVK